MADKQIDPELSKSADKIVYNHIVWSMGAGLIPVPIADFVAVSAIQLDMIKQLCRLYGHNFKESEGKAYITSLSGSGLAKLGARALIKFIPGVGSIVGGIAVSVLSGASTYALGEVFKKHFQTGGTFLDFDPKRLKKIYAEKFEKGKKVARKIKKDQEKTETAAKKHFESKKSVAGADEALKRLAKLKDMKDEGIISEEEFMVLKKKIIDKI